MHGHAHRHADESVSWWRRWVHPSDELTDPRATRTVWVAVVVCAVVTLVGLALLWPDRGDDVLDPALLDGQPIEAVVTGVRIEACTGTDPAADIDCRFTDIRIVSGDRSGEVSVLEASVGGSGASPDAGDEILVLVVEQPDGSVFYSFYEFQRRTPLLLLTLLFVGAVVFLGRWRGVGAIGGLVMSFLVIGGFVLPSLLSGNNPVMVALVGASVVAFIALFLAHGSRWRQRSRC